MELSKSLELFNILSRADLERNNLKKVYRKLMLKYHPDNGGNNEVLASDISEAYDTLKKYLKYLEICDTLQSIGEKKRERVCIDFRDVVKLLKNKRVTLGNRELTRGSLKNLDVIMDITLKIRVNGVVRMYNTFELFDYYKQDYDMHCPVELTEMDEQVEIEILDLRDESVCFKLQGQSLKYRAKIHDSMYLNLLFERKLITDESSEHDN